MVSRSRRSRQDRRWAVAVLLALAFHAASILGLGILRPWTPGELTASEPAPEPIQFVFAQAPDSPPREEPDTFSELPPDRVDIAPEKADFLSNENSRARDRVDLGEEADPENTLPNMTGRSDAPHVPMQTMEEPSDGVDPDADGDRGRVVPTESLLEDLLVETSVARLTRPGGVSDLLQEEMNNPGGDALSFGDISLNTLEWEYAPWIQRMHREFRRNLAATAPSAFWLGIIGGWTRLVVVIERDGTMSSLESVGHSDNEEFHPSLVRAGESAWRATAPFKPLPDGFPEERLVLEVTLYYGGPWR